MPVWVGDFVLWDVAIRWPCVVAQLFVSHLFHLLQRLRLTASGLVVFLSCDFMNVVGLRSSLCVGAVRRGVYAFVVLRDFSGLTLLSYWSGELFFWCFAFWVVGALRVSGLRLGALIWSVVVFVCVS